MDLQVNSNRAGYQSVKVLNELRAGGVAGALAGVIRVIKLNPASVADIVPLDYPINMIIAAAWHQATHK